jgi:chromosome segregation ATPase
MDAMLERVESATQDTEQNIGVIRQEIEKTLKESSERISGFLISSEEKINDLKLNYYQTRAALDRLERSQQESDKAASATRVEVSEAVRESRDLLSDFAAMTNQKIEEMKSTHRRELDGVLTRLDTLRREGESAITRAKQETERTLKDKLDHMTGFLQSSEEKFDALRSEQLAIKVSLDQVEHSREEADKAVAALSGDLGRVLSKTRDEVTSLLQESDERLKSLRADYEKLQVSLESSEKAPAGTAAALDSLKREVSDHLRAHLESADQRYDALTSEHRREIGVLRQEVEEARGQFEGITGSIRNELTQTVLLARQETPELARDFERRLEHLGTAQDNKIRSLSGMVETLKEEHDRALASLKDQLAESARQNMEALASLVKSAGERDSELASLHVELKGSLETLKASESETRDAVGRMAGEFEIFKRETATRHAETLQETRVRLDQLRTEGQHLIGDAIDASRVALTGIIDGIRKDLSETRAELAKRTSETGSEIGALREEIDRLGSATAAEIPAGRSVAEARIEELRAEFRQSLDTILKRLDASAAENQKSLGAVKDELESSLGETAQRLSLIEDSSRDQIAKASFERLREITALRELIDRSRQDTLQVVTELKEKVEATLERHGEDLSRLQEASEERFAAVQAAHQDLKEDLGRIDGAREESHSDLSILKARIENLSSEASKTLADVVSRLEARLNEATAGSGAEVSALRRDLTSLSSEYAEAVKTLHCQSADLSSLRDEMRKSLEDRQPHSEELLNQLRSDYLKEITIVLERIESLRGEDEKALDSLRQETEQKIADESQQIRELLRGTTAQVAELRSGTAVINTVLDHVERLAEDNQKTRQEVTQILEESRSELVGAIGATQETVDLLKSRYLEIQTLLEGIENNRPDSEGAIASFKEEIENHLRNYLSDLGNQGAASPAETEELRTGYRTLQERVSEAVNENKRIQ